MMRKAVLMLMVVSLLLVLGAQTASASGQIIHVVRRGENLYRIALRYGTTVQAIAARNGICNPNRIYVGQRLVIPTYYSGGPSHGGGWWYRVRPGDTLYSIARRFGTTVWALRQANSLANPNYIYAGQRLWISAGGSWSGKSPPPPPRPGFWYTVRCGETLSAIGWRYGVSPWAIAAANGLSNPNYIYAGQRLWIPDP
jgi:LysM repeat protein